MSKRVLITGATRGIGEAIAKKYKELGYQVVGTGTKSTVTPNYLDDCLLADFTDMEDIKSLSNLVQSLDIDVLINNAGINKIDPFCQIEHQDFLQIQQVNVFAPFSLCQAVLPNMEKKGWGRIVNISSVWGKLSKAGRGSYSTSKFAIDGLTLSIASEFASKGILANSVAPGFIDTDMTRKNLGDAGIAQMLTNVPIGRLANVNEVAKFVQWLGSDQNTYISGQNIAIDGGFTRA